MNHRLRNRSIFVFIFGIHLSSGFIRGFINVMYTCVCIYMFLNVSDMHEIPDKAELYLN